jgi:hypothetical protein
VTYTRNPPHPVVPDQIGPADRRQRRLDRAVKLSILFSVHLWVLEGAIRKWVPGTEMALYVARDIVLVACMVVISLTFGHLRKRPAWPFWIVVLTFAVVAVVQILSGQVGYLVAASGVRNYLAPVLLIYLYWSYQPRDVLPTLMRTIRFYVFVQLGIIVLQVLSSPSSTINHEVGSEIAGFVNPGGVVRASGTFSAPIGLAYFLPLALACSLALTDHGTRRSRGWSLAASMAVAASALLGGARGTLVAVGIVLGVYLIRRVSQGLGRGIKTIVLLAVVAVAVYSLVSTFAPTVLDSFSDRFEVAARSENSLERVYYQTFGFFNYDISLTGDGVGTRSQVGRALGSPFDWIETDNTRWVAELGVLGFGMAVARSAAWLAMLFWIISRFRSTTTITVLIAAAFLPTLMYGNINQQPTAQGFTAICLLVLVIALGSRSDRLGLKNQSPTNDDVTGPVPSGRQNGH